MEVQRRHSRLKVNRTACRFDSRLDISARPSSLLVLANASLSSVHVWQVGIQIFGLVQTGPHVANAWPT